MQGCKLCLGHLELALPTGCWCLGSSLWSWITPVASKLECPSWWPLVWLGFVPAWLHGLASPDLFAPAGLPSSPWPWWSCPPVIFFGLTEKCREGAALTVNTLGGFSLTALLLSHPGMICVADLAACGNWQSLERSETVWEWRQRGGSSDS